MAQSYATRFVPSLEGLRGVAALGILLTHVAFQTHLDPRSIIGGILARFDFFVALFFSLSAFVLWRKYRVQGTGDYLRHRASRILPPYLVCVATILLFLPGITASPSAILANLTLTQVFHPDALLPGLTHLWSLSVEVSFYLLLPLLLRGFRHLNASARLLGILGFALIGPLWILSSETLFPTVELNLQLIPFSYFPWFALGLFAAEIETRIIPRTTTLTPRQVLLIRAGAWAGALLVALVASRESFGPIGLVHPSPSEFLARILAGTLFAALILLPYALIQEHRTLLSTPAALQVGRWSYSLFLWHVGVLALVFPLLGIPLFSGHTLLVGALSLALSLVISWASYEWIEKPCRRWFRSKA